MDMFIELFANIDTKTIRSAKQGIIINVYDSNGKEVAEYILLQETHKGF